MGTKKSGEIILEESLGEEWLKDANSVEVPLGNRPLIYLGAAIFLVVLIYLSRIVQLNIFSGTLYAARAEANMSRYDRLSAPRGLIFDRNGDPLAENKAAFAAWLDPKEFLGKPEVQEEALRAIERIFGSSSADVWGLIEQAKSEDFAVPILLAAGIDHEKIIAIEAAGVPTVRVTQDFGRKYDDGSAFSAVLGYTGRVGLVDMKRDASLSGEDLIGRGGVEAFYDAELRGTPGLVRVVRDANGKVLERIEKTSAEIGSPLRLTIDGGLQRYFHERLKRGMASIGRSAGVGIAIDPRNGEILALVSMPSFDINLLGNPGHDTEKRELLAAKDRPLFNRAVSGLYNPGSTIKPLVAMAALREGVIHPAKEIFSPGYLEVPNPYDPDAPTRYLDWRYQGNVNAASAIAQSSNVYFYTVGGGAGEILGLGIGRLREWWGKFNFGKKMGIDLPGEEEGFLPSASWKEKKTGAPWLLGDTYNVSIGQGDLLVTPLQLISYAAAIANGGIVYKPTVRINASRANAVVDLAPASSELGTVREGMRQAVTSPLGTAHVLDSSPIAVAAKTGSAQVENNTKVNALFIGYAPFDNPEIAILVLVEDAREGSLNAVPIAKDVFEWYYTNRLKVKS